MYLNRTKDMVLKTVQETCAWNVHYCQPICGQMKVTCMSGWEGTQDGWPKYAHTQREETQVLW